MAQGHLVGDRYVISRALGRGGMATAYLATDRLWSTKVVLKLVSAPTEELLEAFRFEFDTLRSLEHPHLTRVFDLSIFSKADGGEGTCFYTAEYIDGVTLGEHGRGATWKDIERPICDALEALRIMHAAKIRHGDIKPENILVENRGRGVLIDLSCARPFGSTSTVSGAVSGSWGFMAPELLDGSSADQRADLYAFGASLEQIAQHTSEPLPENVRKLARRLTRKRPEERPADVEEVLQSFGVETALIHPVMTRLGRFVGRQRELRTARGAIEALLSGRPSPRVLHIRGPAGIGRSRLLREIKWFAQQRCRVLESNTSSATCLSAFFSHIVGGDAHPSPSSIQDMLTLRERLMEQADAPVLWVIDDVQLLDDHQRGIFDALIRLAGDTDPLLIVATSLGAATLEGPSMLTFELGSLDDDDVQDWVGSTLSGRAQRRLAGLTGGVPGPIRALLRQLVEGHAREEELGSASGWMELTENVEEMLSSLSAAEERALSLLAIVEQPLSPADLDRFDIDRRALYPLIERGLVETAGAGWKLVWGGDHQHLLGAFQVTNISALHEEVSQMFGELAERHEIDRRQVSELRARQVLHLSRAGETEQASAILLNFEDLHPAAPRAWWQAVEVLAPLTVDPEVHLVTATIERAVGRTLEALERLEAILSRPREPHFALRARVELGSCLLRLGRFKNAIELLDDVFDDEMESELQWRAMLLLTRALTNGRNYDKAVRIAEEALDRCETPSLRAEFYEAASVAHSYAGELSRARAYLDEAVGICAALDDPRLLVRIYGSRALIAFSQGDLDGAIDDQRRSLDLAEESQLSDQVATAALNFGTICHQRGLWAQALDSYDRGLRMAIALGQESTAAHLQLNLAALYVELGLAERALDLVERSVDAARRRDMDLLVAAADVVRAEAEVVRANPRDGRDLLLGARDAMSTVGSRRELAELDVQIAELDVTLGDLDIATTRLGDCRDQVESLDARDVTVRWKLARARLLMERGDSTAAMRLVEGAASAARDMGHRSLEAEAELVASSAWERQGATTTRDTHRRRATELWEQCLAGLPPGLSESFWTHPRRVELQRRQQDPITADVGMKEYKYKRLLDINKRLNSSNTTKQVLNLAIDAAIELTSSERGFVLLVDARSKDKDRLRVAVARNLDQEELGRSHMKFSRGIAERAIRENAPLITSDAQRDGRFPAGSSVHAMHLKSVICVPVTSPTGVHGALYLDNRFQRGLFNADDIELLLAFSDQVAIALSNARLQEELKRKNRALERERGRVEDLLRGQAEEISRLTEVVERQRRPSNRRFDYGEIVGTSRSMEDVFDLLDRVIDTDLPILIQGESGTGKELIARAIHRNSQASEGRLVSINCGALPESLLESELFGYRRGAFTGAERSRDGLIVEARGGTLFLDEVGEMPRTMQVKLLRVLQEHEVQPLGSSKLVPVDFRLICATNRTLQEEVSAERFREDLFYRMSAVEVTLPPLRERSEDVPQLVAYILIRVTERMGRPPVEVTRQAVRKLIDHDWPGNVRQLEHVLTKAVVLAEGDRITAADIELPAASKPSDKEGLSRRAFELAESEQIAKALIENRWNVAKVSRLLGIPRPTLYRRIKRYGLDRG